MRAGRRGSRSTGGGACGGGGGRDVGARSSSCTHTAGAATGTGQGAASSLVSSIPTGVVATVFGDALRRQLRAGEGMREGWAEAGVKSQLRKKPKAVGSVDRAAVCVMGWMSQNMCSCSRPDAVSRKLPSASQRKKLTKKKQREKQVRAGKQKTNTTHSLQ